MLVKGAPGYKRCIRKYHNLVAQTYRCCTVQSKSNRVCSDMKVIIISIIKFSSNYYHFAYLACYTLSWQLDCRSDRWFRLTIKISYASLLPPPPPPPPPPVRRIHQHVLTISEKKNNMAYSKFTNNFASQTTLRCSIPVNHKSLNYLTESYHIVASSQTSSWRKTHALTIESRMTR